METQRQDTKVIETPFGKGTMLVKDENTCHFYFGVCNEDFVRDYQCTVDGYFFDGKVIIFADVGDYDVDYSNPLLPVEVVEKVVEWCYANRERLTTSELLKGVKIEKLLKEIGDIKEDLHERLPNLLREKEAELAALNS